MSYIIRPLGVLNRYGMTKRRPVLKRLSFRFFERPILQHAAAIHYTSQQERAEAESVLELGARSEGMGARGEGQTESRREKAESKKSELRLPTCEPRRSRVSSPGGEGEIRSEQSVVRGPLSVVIPLGLDVAQFEKLPGRQQFQARWPQARGRDIVLFVGRLDPIKNLEGFISAFAQVKRSCTNALLVIAGDGDDAFVHDLKKRAQDLGVANDIIWAGFLEGIRKLEAFSAAKVFVLPSHSENFGIAAVEALGAAVPVVITTGVGIADDVRHKDAGIVVGPRAAEIATAIQQLLADSELARRVSANGARLARERFSLEAMGVALKRLYEQVIQWS